MSKTNNTKAVTQSSGNVFADMGLANPEERLLKARLASLIFDIMESREWTQSTAANVLGITQPDVSNITNGRLKNFSVERLMCFLSKLNQRVTISVQDETTDIPPQEIVIPAATLN